MGMGWVSLQLAWHSLPVYAGHHMSNDCVNYTVSDVLWHTFVTDPFCRTIVSSTSPSCVPTKPLMLQNTGSMYMAQTHHTCTVTATSYQCLSAPQTRSLYSEQQSAYGVKACHVLCCATCQKDWSSSQRVHLHPNRTAQQRRTGTCGRVMRTPLNRFHSA